MWASRPSRASSALSSAASSGSFWVFSCSARVVRLSTRTLPSRSRMSPRGAITLYSRVRLFLASARYCEPESTCRSQSRKKRTAKRATAMPPRTALRRARRGPGLSFCRWYTPLLGSQHRRRATAPHRRLDQRRAEQAPQAEVDRPAEEEGVDGLDQQVADDEAADRG